MVLKAHEDVTTNLARLQKLVDAKDASGEARTFVAGIAKIEAAYSPVALRIVELALNKQTDEAIAMMNQQCRPLLAALVKLTREYSEWNDLRSAEIVARTAADFTSRRNLVVGACLAVLALVVLAGVFITRSILIPIAQAVRIAQTVAEGNLSSTINTSASDETGKLLRALSEMQDSLVRVVKTVRDGSQSVASASVQIAQGNMDLSCRTESQASALEQTAASMEELNSTVKQNADNAQQANRLARRAADVAVEAARAGEQGRGFAVVATEVRNLAQRSAAAAKEIKTLITDSVDRVDQGTALVGKAGSTMDDVVSAIRRVTDIMAEISAASAEQSTGVAQVSDAVNSMDENTQQNAAMVEEMAAAATGLNTQANELVDAVAVFNLGQRVGPVEQAVRVVQMTQPARLQATVTPRKSPALRVTAQAKIPARTMPVRYVSTLESS